MIDNPADHEWSGATPQRVISTLNSTGGILNQLQADAIVAAFDILPNAADPLFNFQVATADQPGKREHPTVSSSRSSTSRGADSASRVTTRRCDGDVEFDNAGDPGGRPVRAPGLSDTMNATLIFEKFGLSARLAYKWRDQFLEGTNRAGGFRNPTYVDEFKQFDLNVSYDVNDNNFAQPRGREPHG